MANPEVIRWKWPDSQCDMRYDGNNWVITRWQHPTLPEPNAQQIVAAQTEYDARDVAEERVNRVFSGRSDLDTLLFEIAFDLENRLRILESQSAVTRAQFRNALKSLL